MRVACPRRNWSLQVEGLIGVAKWAGNFTTQNYKVFNGLLENNI